MGRHFYGVGRLGNGVRSWDLCAFPLVLLSFPLKVVNGNYEQGCEGKSITNTSSLSG